MTQNSNKISFAELFTNSKNPSWIALGLSLMMVLPLGYFLGELNLLFVFIAIPIAFILLIVITKYPTYWVYMVALSSPIYLMSDDTGFSVYDVIFALIYNLSSVIWFVWYIGIKHKRIVRNSADFAILFFFFIGSVSIFIGYLNDVDLFYAIKEFALLSTLLLLFPFREQIKTRKELQIVLVLFAFSAMAISMNTLFFYYKTVTEVITYVYQLQHTIKTNQAVLTAAAFTTVVLLFHNSTKKAKAFISLSAFITVLGLVLSFSRAFWLIFAAGLLFIFLILEYRQKIILVVSGFAMLAATVIIAYSFFGDTANLIFETVEKRFVSSSKGTSDRSMELRYKEYDALLSHAFEYPLGGNGSAKEYAHYNIEQSVTVRYAFSHSSYLQFFYKFGAIIPLFFFYFMLYYLIRSVFLVVNIKDSYYRKLALSAFFSLFLLFVGSFIAAIVANRDGMFVLIFIILIISHAENHYRNQHDQKSIKT